MGSGPVKEKRGYSIDADGIYSSQMVFFNIQNEISHP